jgi:D-3-phosphoglycerate dehydrogenase / 2-oxoglutarate reductase
MGYPEIKIVAVSDLCVTDAIVRQSFAGLVAAGAQLRVIEWKLHDLHDLRDKVIRTEQEGPLAVAYAPELDAAIADCDVLVTHICPVPRSLLMHANRLRVIGCARSGLENVDVEAASERNIAVLHCPLSKTSTAADATVGMMLAGCRGLARAHHQMVQGEWDARFAFFGNSLGLTGRKVGLIGFGNIGKAVARRLQGFEVELMVYDPYQEPGAIKQLGGEPVSLPQLLEKADFVVMLARLDKGTRGLIGAKELAMMQPTAFFINTARAGLVDYGALRQVLQEGRIAGAALDVFDIEPLNPDDALLKLENVTLTPHVAGVSKAGYMQSAHDIAEDIRRFFETGTPKFRANPGSTRMGRP